MDIRQTTFWQGIQDIFPQQAPPTQLMDDICVCSNLCTYNQFIDRVGMAVRRSKRDKTHALLILLQFGHTPFRLGEHHGAGGAGESLIYRVRSCIRSSDSLCGLGGGRFGILLEDVRESAAVPVIIEKLYSTLAGRVGTSPAAVPGIQPNLGAGLLSADSLTVTQVWQDTETALEQAMASGPGSYRISCGLAGQTEMQPFALSGDLYKAYRNDEFYILYQPVVGLGNGRIQALEALLRWRHPVRGCLRPDTFLPLLEENGLIVPAGEKLLQQACRVGRELVARGYDELRVCINISFRQLADRGFLLSVLDALYESGLPPRALQLEFAESVLSRDMPLVQRILPELNSVGVKLAVDRFGTGETSMANLMRLPVDLLKLDCTLVSGLPDDAVSQTIIAGAGAMARATGKAIAAVGVEKPIQCRILEKLACREAQGIHYFRPLPETEIGDVLKP